MSDDTRSCDAWREVASARLDGEADAADERALDQHSARCAPCRAWVARAEALARSLRVRRAEVVPDQTEAILARADSARRGDELRTVVRVLLGAVGALALLSAFDGFRGGVTARAH